MFAELMKSVCREELVWLGPTQILGPTDLYQPEICFCMCRHVKAITVIFSSSSLGEVRY